MSTGGLFRFSRWDALCVAVIPFQLAFFTGVALAYKDLSWPALVALAPVIFALTLQSSGANHNHYHTPFFHARWLNAAARVGFSIISAPKTPQNIGHGIHHAEQELWNDRSLLQMLGLKRPLHLQVLAFFSYVLESFGLKYIVLLVLLRVWPVERIARLAIPDNPELALKVLSKAKAPAMLRAIQIDVAAWLAFRIVLCLIDWRFFLFYFVPLMYVIETLRQGENYFQHWGATDPWDSTRDSVSCYGKFYNLLTFNLGHHQEHHYRPGAHWLKLPELRTMLPADRRVVPFMHYVNLPIFYPELAAQLGKGPAPETVPARPDGEPRV